MNKNANLKQVPHYQDLLVVLAAVAKSGVHLPDTVKARAREIVEFTEPELLYESDNTNTQMERTSTGRR